VAAFADEVMACAARVEIGPLGQTFWAIVDRSSGELVERTRARLPGVRGEVRATPPGTDLEDVCTSHAYGGVVEIAAPGARGTIRLGEGKAIEARCRARGGGEVWTRKRAGVPADLDLRLADGRRWRARALGVEDETCGYHPRRTVWRWSAGAGAAADGRPVAWNLVEGINDPEIGSERAIWISGEPFEPAPVAFEGLEAIGFADGSRLAFTAEAERSRAERRLGVSYRYRQPFGTFIGTLPGGIALAAGLGVMEHHDAVW
jgi:hypothetical protein